VALSQKVNQHNGSKIYRGGVALIGNNPPLVEMSSELLYFE